MDIITSRQNPLIQETAKLKDKKYRDEKRMFLFEGIKLTKEAISSKVDIVNIFLTEKCAKKYPFLAELAQEPRRRSKLHSLAYSFDDTGSGKPRNHYENVGSVWKNDSRFVKRLR